MSFKDWYNKELANDKRSAVYIAGAKRGFEVGQQSKQAQINKALELLQQPMQGTVADLLNELEDILDDT